MPSLNEVARSFDVLTANARSVMSGLTEWATSTDSSINIKIAVPTTSSVNHKINYIASSNAQIPTLNGISSYIDGTPMNDGEVGECWVDKKIFIASSQSTSSNFSSLHRPGWIFDAFEGSAPLSAVKSNGRWTSNGSLIYTDRTFLSSDYMYDSSKSSVAGAILSSNVRSYFYNGLFAGSGKAADSSAYGSGYALSAYSEYITNRSTTINGYRGSTPFFYVGDNNGSVGVLCNDCTTAFVLDNGEINDGAGTSFSVFSKAYGTSYGSFGTQSNAINIESGDDAGIGYFSGTIRIGSDGINGGTTTKKTYIDGGYISIGDRSASDGIYPYTKLISIGAPASSTYKTNISFSGNSCSTSAGQVTINSTSSTSINGGNSITAVATALSLSAANNMTVIANKLSTTTYDNTISLTTTPDKASILTITPGSIRQASSTPFNPKNTVQIYGGGTGTYPSILTVGGFSSANISSQYDSIYGISTSPTTGANVLITDITQGSIHQYIGARKSDQVIDPNGAGISVRGSSEILETTSVSANGTVVKSSILNSSYSGGITAKTSRASGNGNGINFWQSSSTINNDNYILSLGSNITSPRSAVSSLSLSGSSNGVLSIMSTNPNSGLFVNVNSSYSAFYSDSLVNMTLNKPWSEPSSRNESNTSNASLVISTADFNGNPVSATLPNGFNGTYAALSAFGETKSTLGDGVTIYSGSSYVAVSSSEAVIGSTDNANVCRSYVKVNGSGTYMHGGLTVEGGSIQAMKGLQVTGGDVTIGDEGDHRNLIVYGSMSATDGIAPTCVISSKTDYITNRVSDWANLSSNSLSAVCDVADPSNNYEFAGQSGGIRNIIMRITLPVPSDPAMSATWLISSTIIHIAGFSAGISTYPVNAFYRIESAYDHDDNAHEGYLPFNSSFNNTADGMSVIITTSGSTTCGPKAFVVNKNVLGSWNIYVNAYINLGSNPPAGSGNTTIAVRGTMSAILVNPTVQTNGI